MQRKWILYVILLTFEVYSNVHSECPSKDVCHKCTDTELFCRSNQINQAFINNLPGMITPNIVNITIRGGNVPELPANIFGNCSHDSSKKRMKLKYVSLRKNQIKTIHGRSFHCAPNLETLDLSDNEWFASGAKHSATFAQLPNLKVLDLTDAMKENASRHVHVRRLSWLFQNSSLTNLKKLLLGRNDLLTFTKEAANSLCSMENLEYLDLRENNMAKITLNGSCLQFIYHINLRDNAFSTIQTSTLKAFDEMAKLSKSENHMTVDLRGNQWICDCHLKNFTKWLKTTKVSVKFTNMTCHDGKNLGKQLEAIGESDLVCVAPEKPSNAGVVVVSILFAIICCVVLVVAYLKRDSIKACYHSRISEPFKRGYFAKTGNYSYSSVSENVDNVNV